MEKYGFIYIWYDRKRKMYYVGCHWGTIDDGYICSSNRMRDAYRRRPDDFKRRILESNIQSREQTYEKEHLWFSFIKEEELGKKYYNLRKHKWGHWSTDIENKLSISEKISIKTKEAMNKPEIREKYLEGLKYRDNKSSDLGVLEKRRTSMIITMSKKFPTENRKKPKTNSFEEYVELHRTNTKAMWDSRTDEERTDICRKISEGLTGKPKTGKVSKGHKKSEEQKEKIRLSNIKAYENMSEEKKKEKNEKISLKNRGKKRTEEQKLEQSLRIKEMWEKRKAGIIPMPNYNKNK